MTVFNETFEDVDQSSYEMVDKGTAFTSVRDALSSAFLCNLRNQRDIKKYCLFDLAI